MKFPVILNPSPNYNDRPFGTKIDTIVLHYTGMPSAEEALAKLCDGSDETREQGGRVSAHYMIDEEGKIYALVDERDRAWHAGESYWRGRTDVNNFSIGIELVNPGHEYGYKVFPRAQLDALIEVCAGVLKRHPIKPENIVGHSDVALGRKIDPGEKFNWRHLARNNIGLWPEAEAEDYPRAQFYLSSPTALRNALIKFGYNPDAHVPVMCQAFNRRFGRSDGTMLTWEVAASLSWMNRKILKVAA